MGTGPELPSDPEPAASVAPAPRRWLGPLFALAGLGLVPWTAFLVATLPSEHTQPDFYDLAWGGFDLALAALLVATGVGLLRGALWVQNVASAAAALLVCDAWFDVLGSRPGNERALAIAMAVGAELPAAVLCVLVARRVEEVSEHAQRYALAARRLLPARRERDPGSA